MKNVLAASRLWRRSVSDHASTSLLLSHREMSSVRCAKLEYSQHGIPMDVVELREEQLSTELRTGQVLVKLLASPVNPADINTIQVTRSLRCVSILFSFKN